MLHLCLDHRLSFPDILLPLKLPLATGQLRVLLGVVDRDVHLLHALEIRSQILLETARNESACGIATGEEVVAAAGSVDDRVCRDIEDRAIDGNVDRQGSISAIVERELLRVQEDGSSLESRR